MKLVLILVIVLVVLVVVVGVAIAVGAGVFGKRQYQRYKGLERQRGAARQARSAGVSRLEEASQRLLRAQRSLVDQGRHQDAQAIEQARKRLVTATDRHRYASHGYAPLGSDNPVQGSELAALQEHDAAIIGDTDRVLTVTEQLELSSRTDGALDVPALERAIDDLVRALDRRKALT